MLLFLLFLNSTLFIYLSRHHLIMILIDITVKTNYNIKTEAEKHYYLIFSIISGTALNRSATNP